MTHEGSRMGHSEADIKKTVCRRDFASGIACPGRQRARGRPEVAKWLRRIGVIE